MGADRTVLRDAFEAEHAVVDVAANVEQARQIAQTAADVEVVGVVERGLGAKCAGELEVLLTFVRL
jgi:hypothetical protein